MNRKSFDKLPKDLQEVVMEVGRELQQMVSLSTTAEYVMSLDTVDLSGVKRTRLEGPELDKALQSVEPVEKEWLELDGPWKDKRPEMLKAVKTAISDYRSFTGK